MNLAGIQKISFIDFPNKISSVVFTQGCNMNCSYCHNMSLIKNDTNVRDLSEKDFFIFIKRRIGLIDAVVISGGEPTLQKDLKEFTYKLKDLDFLVKLDTNGTNPALLKDLIENRLVDYVAMDIKATENKYNDVCGLSVNIYNIKESISILKSNIIPYEFRTTYTPELNQADLLDITNNLIKGSQKYVLQQCRNIDETTGIYTGNNINRRIDIDTLKFMTQDVNSIDARGEFVFADNKEQFLSKDSLLNNLQEKINAGFASFVEISRFNEMQSDCFNQSVDSLKLDTLIKTDISIDYEL